MQKLFSEFTSTSSEQWKAQLVKDLKGIDYDTLVWKSNSGLEILPFYTADNSKQPTLPVFTTNDWAICENIIVTDEKKANAQALNALQNGASGLIFEITQETNYNFLLKDILLQHIYSLFKIKAEFEEDLRTYLTNKPCGNTCFIENDGLLKDHFNFMPFTNISINTSIYQEAGSNTVNEIAFSLAHLNEYLDNASKNNSLLSIKKLHISLSIGGDFFMEIAKLRTLRKAMEFLLSQYKIQPSIHIHAQTTLLNKSNIDSYTNMLRSTTEAMSSLLGGANSILVLPFDSEFNDASDFSLRMARNQQLILKEESYLNVVADVAAGAYYIENLTTRLGEEAWKIFKEIELKGGLKACLKSHEIQTMITEDAKQLIQQFKERKLVLVGVNKFQNKNDEKSKDKRSDIHQKYEAFSGIKPITLSNYLEIQPAT